MATTLYLMLLSFFFIFLDGSPRAPVRPAASTFRRRDATENGPRGRRRASPTAPAAASRPAPNSAPLRRPIKVITVTVDALFRARPRRPQ